MINKNIENLQRLWLLASKPFGALKKRENFNIIDLDFSEWPNRIWLNNLDDTVNVELLHRIMDGTRSQLSFSTWHPLIFSEYDEEKVLNIPLKSVQTGMSLSLANYELKETVIPIILEKVTSHEKSTLWSTTFKRCFNYFISDLIVNEIKNSTDFYLIKKDGATVGCFLSLEYDGDIGIHSFGILPEYRKKGIAEETMRLILKTAQEKFISNVHLQASAMAFPIYKKIGFQELFKMCNYKK